MQNEESSEVEKDLKEIQIPLVAKNIKKNGFNISPKEIVGNILKDEDLITCEIDFPKPTF